MNRREVMKHEICHALANAAGLLLYAERQNESGIDLLKSATVFIETSSSGEGETCLDMVNRETKYFAAGCGALAPAITSKTAAAVTAHTSLSALFKSTDISEADKHVYRAAPVPESCVVLAGLASMYYLEQISNVNKFVDLIDDASRQHDNLLPLGVIADYDRISHCLKLAKSSVARFRQEADPVWQAEQKDMAAQRRWEAKRA